MKKISVLLVDDHTIVRQGMRALLGCEADLEVLAEAENGRDALQMVIKNKPEVVVMDLAMPYMNGAEATRKILKSCPSTKVLIISSYTDDKCVSAVMEAGALGYLTKQTAACELPKAIREVRCGNSFFSPAISKSIRDKRLAAMNGEKAQTLTARESQVLQLIADGFSNKEMAVELDISIKTVEKHRQQVMNKLNIHETAGLTRFAISEGLVVQKAPVGI
jgi:DNA-binding NarL/FixJ family response regulator